MFLQNIETDLREREIERGLSVADSRNCLLRKNGAQL